MKAEVLTACYGLAKLIAAELADDDDKDVVWAVTDCIAAMDAHIDSGAEIMHSLDSAAVLMLNRISRHSNFSKTAADKRYNLIAKAMLAVLGVIESGKVAGIADAYGTYTLVKSAHAVERM